MLLEVLPMVLIWPKTMIESENDKKTEKCESNLVIRPFVIKYSPKIFTPINSQIALRPWKCSENIFFVYACLVNEQKC